MARLAATSCQDPTPDRRAASSGEADIEKVLGCLTNVKHVGRGQYEARCPVHDDQHNSLSVGLGDDGRILLCCHACGKDATPAIVNALGLTMADLFRSNPDGGKSNTIKPARRAAKTRGKIVKTYNYVDASGGLLFQVCRCDPKGDFPQRRPDGKGGWIWNLNGTPRVLYRLPELLAADATLPVFIVEGEKDVDNVMALGLTATCNPGGARKWSTLSDDTPLHGRSVVLVADKDEAGRGHVQDVAQRLHGKAANIKVVEMPDGQVDGKPIKDASDWIESLDSRTPEEIRSALLNMAAAAKQWTPASEASEQRPGDQQPVVLDPADPLPSGRLFIRRNYTISEHPTLLHHAGVFYRWAGRNYLPVDDAAMRAGIYRFAETAFRLEVGELVPFKPTRGKVDNLLDAIKAVANVPASLSPPAWLDGAASAIPPAEIVACANGLLHLPAMALSPATPQFFNLNALDFDYDPAAPAPAGWLSFLADLWGSDSESVATLQEWCGYCLSADTRQQKILLIVGPKRSGKGTIARIVTRLFGPMNVCGPTLASLATQFGLATLIGKTVAIISDARLSGKTDHAVIAERLLSISGEDALSVPRKYLPDWTGRLPVRFVVLSNELPRLTDASGALASRFLVLTLTRSFYGKEDPNLSDKLLVDLPGILLWSIEGWRRLRERGHFVQPASSAEAIEELEELGSPIRAFIRQCCVTGPGAWVCANDLFKAWQCWCAQVGRDKPGSIQTFGRDLRAALPGLQTKQPRAEDGSRDRVYNGIALTPAARAAMDVARDGPRDFVL